MNPAIEEHCTHCGGAHDARVKRCPRTKRWMSTPGLCGTLVDRYRIETYLGGGGFGAVYKARHTVMDRVVAFKVLADRMQGCDEMVDRFFQEARAAAAIGSPHIVQVHDAGQTPEGHSFLVMEYVDGCSLEALVAESTRLTVGRIVGIVTQVLSALGEAHKVGIVHRDIKPANIMLEGTYPGQADGRDVVRVVDFGISKVKNPKGSARQLTQTGVSMGTPGFAAPEQFGSARDVDERADVYAVAVMLFQILAGRMPFEGETYEQIVLQMFTHDPPPLGHFASELPEPLRAVVDKGLARNPEDRWKNAQEFSEALQRAAEPVCDHALTIVAPGQAESAQREVSSVALAPTATPAVADPATPWVQPGETADTYVARSRPPQVGRPEAYSSAPPLYSYPPAGSYPASRIGASTPPQEVKGYRGPLALWLAASLVLGLGVGLVVVVFLYTRTVASPDEGSSDWAASADAPAKDPLDDPRGEREPTPVPEPPTPSTDAREAELLAEPRKSPDRSARARAARRRRPAPRVLRSPAEPEASDPGSPASPQTPAPTWELDDLEPFDVP